MAYFRNLPELCSRGSHGEKVDRTAKDNTTCVDSQKTHIIW